MAPAEHNIDYYAVLEVSNTATLEVVTSNYRRLARLRHPDKNLHRADSTAVFQLVSRVTSPDELPSTSAATDWPRRSCKTLMTRSRTPQGGRLMIQDGQASGTAYGHSTKRSGAKPKPQRQNAGEQPKSGQTRREKMTHDTNAFGP